MTLKLNGSSSGYTAIDAPAAAGSNTLVLPTTNGSAGQVLQTDGNGNLTWVTISSGNPLIQVDRWRLRSNFSTDATYITDWERPDASERLPGRLGTGMTHSSGKFSFPVTGIWEVRCTIDVNIDGNEGIAQVQTNVTNNDNTYYAAAFARVGDTNTQDIHMMARSAVFFDITNTTNQHVKFQTDSFGGASTLQGDNNEDISYVDFIRWGDT